MFRWFNKKIKFLLHQTDSNNQTPDEQDTEPVKEIKIKSHLADNMEYLKEQLGDDINLIYRSFRIGKENGRKALLVTVRGMIEKKEVNESILKPLMEIHIDMLNQSLINYIKESVISVIDIDIAENMSEVISQLVSGKIILFLEWEKKALIIGAPGWKERTIEEPITEAVVRGPREGFVESIETNMIMVRKRIRHPDLRFKTVTLGTKTHTRVVISYIEGIANQEIVEEVKRRLENINTDFLYDSGLVEEYIEDAPFSIFPTVGITEKPDIAVSRILEGRVAIFVDNTPVILTVPQLLINPFQKSDDYYSRPFYVSLIRLIRVLAFLTATMLPGVAIALMNFHTELIPTPLLISLVESREGVPFPLVYEVLFILLMYEWLREAGIRMPRPIGQAVNIIGAVILGETAVTAGFVGAPMVIIIAIAAIASFIIPFFYDTIAILRLLFIIASSLFGFYGLLVLGMVIVTHLASLRSFGIPYTAPLFPLTFKDLTDSIIRLPIWMLLSRPKVLRPGNLIRQKWGGWTGDKNKRK